MTEEVDFVRLPRRPASDPVLDHTVGLVLLEAWPMKSAYAVQEIFKTEQDYVKDLHGIIQGYRTPLSNHLKADNEGHKVISTLFCNVEEIFNLHKLLLHDLTTHQADPHAFGQVFVTSLRKFEIYSDYCMNYDSALHCLQQVTSDSKILAMFILDCQRQLGHALPLSSQLIKPVQRIMRYHIMLKEVVKHFDGNHHGFRSLDSAHKAMVRIGRHINEVKKQKENRERVEDLQCNTTGWIGKDMTNLSAYGELIIEDGCKVGHRGLERQVVLFEKLLLFVKKKDVKKYTYKAHIVTSELHIHEHFSESNPTMFKVSSLLQKHHSYVVDVGTAKKLQDWLNKMHALIRKVIEQAKMGRLLSLQNSGRPSPVKPQVKRRRIEEDDVIEEVDSAFPLPESAQTKSSFLRSRSRASRLLGTKKRSRGDVRELFTEDKSSPKLQSYTVQPYTQTNSCPPVMQTIPESGMPPQPSSAAPSNHTTLQHLEPVAEPERQKQHGTTSRDISSSTSMDSMDSMLSLSDVEFGMEERAGVSMDTSGGSKEAEEKGKSKLIRRAAIKVKRTGVTRGLSASSSTSSLIKARAKQAREASRSPPPLLEEAGGGLDEVSSEEQEYSLLPFILEKMHSAPSGSSDLSSSYSISGQESSSLYSREEGGSAMDTAPTPVPASLEQVQDSGVAAVVVCSSRVQADGGGGMEVGDSLYLDQQSDPEYSLSKFSPFKRPRSNSQDQEGLTTSNNDQSVLVEIVEDEDELELGESCGQAKMRGRAAMPVVCDDAEDGRGLESAEWEVSGVAGDFSLDQSSSSSFLGGSVNGVGVLVGKEQEVEVVETEMGSDFMIVEDSSDSEEEEEEEGEDSVEDFELTADELEASLLEAVEVGEAMLPHEMEETASAASPSADQVVPRQQSLQKLRDLGENVPTSDGAVVSNFFSTLNESIKTADQSVESQDEAAASSVFHFEASPGNTRDVEIYGTLPHRKKPGSTNPAPLKASASHKPANQSVHDPTRLSRAQGFSRLLEFTRQQCQVEMETHQMAVFDVTQSLPVFNKLELCDIEEHDDLEAEDVKSELVAGNETEKEDRSSENEILDIEDESPSYLHDVLPETAASCGDGVMGQFSNEKPTDVQAVHTDQEEVVNVDANDVEGITPEVIKTDEIAAEEAVLDSFENSTGEIITKVVPISVADTEKQETNGAFGTWISNFMPSKAGFLALGAGVAAVLVVFAIGGHFNKTT